MPWSSEVVHDIKVKEGHVVVTEHRKDDGLTIYRWTIQPPPQGRKVGQDGKIDWGSAYAFTSDEQYASAEAALRDGLVVALGIPDELVIQEHERFLSHKKSSMWPHHG